MWFAVWGVRKLSHNCNTRVFQNQWREEKKRVLNLFCSSSIRVYSTRKIALEHVLPPPQNDRYYSTRFSLEKPWMGTSLSSPTLFSLSFNKCSRLKAWNIKYSNKISAQFAFPHTFLRSHFREVIWINHDIDRDFHLFSFSSGGGGGGALENWLGELRR